MITFHLETKVQYLGLNQKNAESLAPLFSQHLVPVQILGQCELRDVIHSFPRLPKKLDTIFCIDKP